MNARSIKVRLVAWYAVLLTGIFLLLCALLYLDLRHFLENGVRESQARRARLLGNVLLTRVQQTGEPYMVSQIKEWFAPVSNDRFIRVTRGDGTLVYVSEAPKDGSFDPAEVPIFSPQATEVSRRQKLSSGSTLIIASLRFKSAGNPDYLVEFGELLDPVEKMLNHLFLQLALGLPLAVGIVAVGGFLLVQRALRPVEHITRAAEQITQLNLSDRLPVAETGDELAQLSLALNRMIERLDDAFQNSKRFVADASHDLRTPLTILRGELECLVADPAFDQHLRGRYEGLLEEVIHLGKIVEQLFTLSQLDSGAPPGDWTQFDLAELAGTTAEQMILLAEDKNISLAAQAENPVNIRGDRSRVKQVVVNLLDNAIKYTREGGKIRLRVYAARGRAVLEVEDSGIGIPREALPHVFERFFRVDKARSSDSESAGLGLAIVKAICLAHGAELEVLSVPGVGSRFLVKFPLQKTEAPISGHEAETLKAVVF